MLFNLCWKALVIMKPIVIREMAITVGDVLGCKSQPET